MMPRKLYDYTDHTQYGQNLADWQGLTLPFFKIVSGAWWPGTHHRASTYSKELDSSVNGHLQTGALLLPNSFTDLDLTLQITHQMKFTVRVLQLFLYKNHCNGISTTVDDCLNPDCRNFYWRSWQPHSLALMTTSWLIATEALRNLVPLSIVWTFGGQVARPYEPLYAVHLIAAWVHALPCSCSILYGSALASTCTDMSHTIILLLSWLAVQKPRPEHASRNEAYLCHNFKSLRSSREDLSASGLGCGFACDKEEDLLIPAGLVNTLGRVHICYVHGDAILNFVNEQSWWKIPM